tara:strand:- start:216 stop:440 length:225 start_codon:yes stop_codon:yes gene_type:complete
VVVWAQVLLVLRLQQVLVVLVVVLVLTMRQVMEHRVRDMLVVRVTLDLILVVAAVVLDLLEEEGEDPHLQIIIT